MLETGFHDLSFRVLAQECNRRREEVLDEARERTAGLLAVALVIGAPLCYVLSGAGISLSDVSFSDVSLVESSEAAEPAAGPTTFAPPPVNAAAVLSRLEPDQLSASDVRDIQTHLKRKGFDPGAIDGIAGERTLSALNRYRQSLQLPATQTVSRESAGPLLDQ